jgi:hypothetical protein
VSASRLRFSRSLPGVAVAKITIAIGGASCLCYLPTVLAEQLGEYKKAGLDIEHRLKKIGERPAHGFVVVNDVDGRLLAAREVDWQCWTPGHDASS